MAIVIDEIVVTVEVTDASQKETVNGQISDREKQEIIAICAEKVMEMLNEKNER